MSSFLYRKEKQVLEFLLQFQAKYGYSPTLVEIAKGTGYRSVSTIHTVIRNLVEKGFIQKVDGNTRVLTIKEIPLLNTSTDVKSSVPLPLMGYITAGKPLEPHPDPNATFQVSASLINGATTTYALQVKGNSMVDDGLFNDDYLIIERTTHAHNGDIVIAVLDSNSATIKRFYVEQDSIVLKPPISNTPPLHIANIRIQGKLVAAIRRFPTS